MSATSDLYGCYFDLLSGVAPESLAAKYVRIEVLAAQELYAKGVTLEELKRFQDRRAGRIEAAAIHGPLECSCGLFLFDEAEYRQHLAINPENRREHTLKRARL